MSHQQQQQQQQQQPQQQQQQQLAQMHQHRVNGPNFGMSVSPRLQGHMGLASPVMSPPMHSPATSQMSMGSQSTPSSIFVSSNAGNNNNLGFTMQTSSASNGFHFNEDFLGPPVQSPGGVQASGGLPEDNGIDSILGVEDPAISSQVNVGLGLKMISNISNRHIFSKLIT
jgi:hypothetical protein